MINESGLDLSVVVLVLREVTQQVAEAEARQIQLFYSQQKEESKDEQKGE